MDKEQALSLLENCIISATGWERDAGHHYGAVISAVAKCIAVKANRKEIAEKLNKHHKGSITRFMVLGRAEMERKARVQIGSRTYLSPVEALQKESVTLTATYKAWQAVMKTPSNKPRKEPIEAARDAILKMKVTTSEGSLSVAEDPRVWAGAMAGLLNCPIALRVLPDRERKRMQSVMVRSLEGKGTEADTNGVKAA